MSDSVVIVTGANAGIGLAASHQLAARGATVVMACRNAERGGRAVEEVLASCSHDRVYLELLDTSSLDSVRDFAARVTGRWPMIHALINNAGAFDISKSKPSFTEEGFESIWATNYLGPYLLTQLLSDALRGAAPGRIVDVSSKGLLAYPFLKVDPEAAAAGESFSPERAYYQSKLAALIHTMALARENDPAELVAHAVWVPAVKVALDRIPPISPLKRSVYMLKRRFALEPGEMAKTYVALALDPEWARTTGGLVDHQQKLVKVPARASDLEAARELHRCSEAQVRAKR